MRTLSPIDMAQMAVSSSDSSYVVLELENMGMERHWNLQFPTLDAETLSAVAKTGVAFLEYDSRQEAVEAFERITLDCATNDTGDFIKGTVTFVSTEYGKDDGHDTMSWDIDDETRPVFRAAEHRRPAWTCETIMDRI